MFDAESRHASSPTTPLMAASFGECPAGDGRERGIDADVDGLFEKQELDPCILGREVLEATLVVEDLGGELRVVVVVGQQCVGERAELARVKYAAFGEVESAVGGSSGVDPSVGAEPRFQGMTLDSTTGLYFVRARSYDVRTGRFVSRDPKDGMTRRPESFVPYAFANGSPTAFRDPTGEDTLEELMIGVAIIGLAVASYAVVELGFLRRARVARDAEFELHLPIPQLIPTLPQKVSPAPNPDEEPDRVDDPTPPIPPDLDDPDDDQTIWYHYTNQINYESIEQSRTIRSNAQGRVYLTKSRLDPFAAFYALFMGAPGYQGKGTHVIILTLRDGVLMTPGTQQNEWYHRGSLSEPSDMTILWSGANPF